MAADRHERDLGGDLHQVASSNLDTDQHQDHGQRRAQEAQRTAAPPPARSRERAGEDPQKMFEVYTTKGRG